MKTDTLKYNIIEIDPPGDYDFVLEQWLADLLVDTYINNPDNFNKYIQKGAE